MWLALLYWSREGILKMAESEKSHGYILSRLSPKSLVKQRLCHRMYCTDLYVKWTQK